MCIYNCCVSYKKTIPKRILNMGNKKLTILIGLLLSIIPLHKIVENILNISVVTPLMSKIESNIFNDVLALIFVSYLTYNFIVGIRRNVYLSMNYVVILLGLTLIYLYYRVSMSIWTFTPFSFCNKIAYSDVLLFLFFLEFIKKAIYKSKNESISTTDGFIFDNPLDKNGDDKLEREKYAKTICKRITNTYNDKSAFSIGINGDWGVGKTSFLNLIQRNLDESKNIIIHFNPWLNNGASSIINEFFKILGTEVNKYNSDLSNKIEKYGKLLLQFENSNINKILKPILFFNGLQKSTQSEYKDINESISKLNKKIIIFIDDLDRLDNDEIIEVIRIIRNTANFANTIFIAAYDRNYLVNALKKINSYNNEYFLEKIFQVEIHLPEYEMITINNRVSDLINPHLSESDKEKLHSLLFDSNYSFSYRLIYNHLENVIRTIRDATRLANSFILSYSHLKGEVNIKDLYYLELLKLKFPGVYNLILQEKDNYLTLENENSQSYSYSSKISYSLKRDKEKNTQHNPSGNKYKLTMFMEQNSSIIAIQQKSIPTIIAILEFLFPDKEASYYHGNLEPLSIADPKSFERYSYYRLLERNLSQVEFDTYLLKTEDEFKTKMEEWISLGLRKEISDKFIKITEYENKNKFEKTIKGILNFARIPKNENIENDYSAYDNYDFRNKINNNQNVISDKFYNGNVEEYRTFLKDIIQVASSPYLRETQIIFELLKSIDEDFILPPDFLNELRLNFFQKYLESVDKMDLTIFHLYHNCDLTNVLTIGGIPSTNTILSNINPDATKLLLDFVKNKDLDGFIYWMYYSQPFEKKRYAILAENVYKIFKDFSKFKNFLSQFNESDYKYLSEFNKFFDECEKVNFKEFIEFEFKDIPLRN
jgi:hypothetical protein